MLDQFFGQGEGKRIAKWVSVSLMFFVAFLLVKIITDLKRLPGAGDEVYPQSTITVNGKGEAYAIPDIASFSFSVTELAKTVAEAQQKLDKKIEASLAAVKEAGIEDKDIKTISYNVYPKYEWEQTYCVQVVGVVCPPGKNVLNGYEVSQTIEVKVREIEKAADLVTKVGSADVSNIGSLEFTVDNREEFVAKAREEAINKAKDQAKVLAKQLGVSLGKIMYYSDNTNMPYPYYAEGKGGDMSVMSAAPMRAQLPEGESKITADISITYELK
jgi:uncharacterized protein YggE